MKTPTKISMTRLLALVLAALALFATGCGSDDAVETSSGSSAASNPADCADGNTKTAGVLTVATGEPVFPPWMMDDDPSNGQGFESAMVYAVAGELGLDTVEWVRTGFDEAIAPGAKSYDFNIQQFSITAAREEVVDFADGYYAVEQAIIGSAAGDIAGAGSLGDLSKYQLGAAIGTTSLDYVDQQIDPGSKALVFDDNAAAKSAFDAGQVDGIVFDLPTAFYITAVEIPEAAIIGVLPRAGGSEELGMLFEEGSGLVSCVNGALANLRAAGTVDALEDEWLNSGGAIPSLSN